MQLSVDKVLSEVREGVTPTRKERDQISALFRSLERKVDAAARKSNVKAIVRLEGSIAKDTWLSGERDIDIFMRVPLAIPRSSLGEVCLRVARKATRGYKQIERFAEHPYLESVIDGVKVNIVPCYEARQGEWRSATDRTPFHTDYVNDHFNESLRIEVRLLKKFMKGIGVYGAEIKIGGFSGYLSELLILNYKSFLGTLKAFARIKHRIVVDIENHYENRKNEIQLLFKEPLVIIDPVDKGRNVASAVQPQRLYTFVAAAQAFLEKPTLEFFYPSEIAVLTAKELKQELRKRGSRTVFLACGEIKAVPDILWGQIYKSQRSLQKLLALNDFKILRNIGWSDEKKLSMFIFELENCCISMVKKHLGPPLEKENECRRFLVKHRNGLGTICGPYIEDGRWVVLIKRKYTDACVLLRERLRENPRKMGIANQISRVMSEGFQVYVNEDIVSVYRRNAEFARFLTSFLSGKPAWLESA